MSQISLDFKILPCRRDPQASPATAMASTTPTKRSHPYPVILVRSPTEKLKPLARRRGKAQETQKQQSDEKKTVVGVGGLISTTMTGEDREIWDWMKANRHMVSFLNSTLRQGKLKQLYEEYIYADDAQSGTGSAASGLKSPGPRVFKESAKKWGDIKPSQAPALLAAACSCPPMKGWYGNPKHDEKDDADELLPFEAAVIALFKVLGVTKNTPIVGGHPLAFFLEPLKWLCREVVAVRGNSIKDTTKVTIEEDSKWWHLEETAEDKSQRVLYCHMRSGKTEAKLKGVNWDDFHTWKLINEYSFLDCKLVGGDDDYDACVATSMKSVMADIIFDTEFHFGGPLGQPPDFPPEPPAQTSEPPQKRYRLGKAPPPPGAANA